MLYPTANVKATADELGEEKALAHSLKESLQLASLFRSEATKLGGAKGDKRVRVCDEITELLRQASSILDSMCAEEEEQFMKEIQIRSGDIRRTVPPKAIDPIGGNSSGKSKSESGAFDSVVVSVDGTLDAEDLAIKPSDRKKTIALEGGGDDVKKIKRTKKRGVTLEDELFAAPTEVVTPESEEQLKYKRKVEDEIISSEEVCTL